MVLETEVAIGLASAVITFVSFTVNVASKTKQYYQSPDGMLQENRELLSIAESFKRFNDDLLSSLDAAPSLNLTPRWNKKDNSANKKNKSRTKETNKVDWALAMSKLDRQRIKLTSSERALIVSARQCQQIAVEFIELLDRLKVQEGSGKWKSFREALNTFWSKEMIEEKISRLRRAREELMLNLLMVTSNRQLAAQKIAKEDNWQLSQAILGAIHDSRAQLEGHMAELTKALKSVKSSDDQQPSDKLEGELRSSFSDFSHRVLELAEDRNARRNTRLMLHSLDFLQRDHRYKKIPEAHRTTFNWLFEQDHNQPQPWADLVEWLAAEHNAGRLYWITGKAGSGKSTLMRYLVDDARIQYFLRQWAGSKDLAVASCYFWNPGSEKLQKSLEGLLRTLLRDLLTQIPSLADSISQWRWQSYELGATNLPAWTQTELLSAFNAAMSESRKYAYVCLFIDGLDEFEGDDRARLEIINLLKQASDFPNVKVCVSSRPWRIFEDAFDTRPSLKLEDLTSRDIEIYVQDMLISDEKFQNLHRKDPSGCLAIAQEVVARAQGVFLWVNLVVRELLTGLRNEDRLIDLQRRLHETPPDLEDYFAHMLGTLDKFYLEQANQLCQVALQGNPSSTLLTYYFIHEEDPDYAMKLPIRVLEGEELLGKLDFMERRLNTLCKGLLEVQKLPGVAIRSSRRVEFLHRTVRDFLRTDALTKMLIASREPFDVNSALCKAFLAEIKSLPFVKEDPMTLFEILGALLEQARAYESIHDDALTLLLDELDRSIKTQYEKYVRFTTLNGHWANYYRIINWRQENIFFPRDWENTFLSIAIWWKLYHYVKEKLIQQPELVRDKNGRPLADYLPSFGEIEERDKTQLTEINQLIKLAVLPPPAKHRRKSLIGRSFLKAFQKT
ncbi:MAG: hypothetical protein Q9167_006580 [Letrouitia subvulpina]